MGARLGCPLLQQVNRREESHQVLAGRLPLTIRSTYVEVWLAMRGTDHALLDRLGRITGGVTVLRPQGSSATLPDLPSSSSTLLVRLPKHTGAGHGPQSLSVRSEE